MGKVVNSADFADTQIAAFFKSILRVDWSINGSAPLPDWVETAANEFAAANPKPTPSEFRLHIDHAVAVAMGWDHPDQPEMMLSAATKSFYLLAWLDHLQEHQPKRSTSLDTSLALRVSFTPVMTPVDAQLKKSDKLKP